MSHSISDGTSEVLWLFVDIIAMSCYNRNEEVTDIEGRTDELPKKSDCAFGL